MRNPKPDWLRIRVRSGQGLAEVEGILADMSLNTVCTEANCPNRMECFARKTATFMILGRVCTRNCTFCNVEHGAPDMVDPREPARVAEAVARLGLRHAVITSVTRDDLDDGGAGHFADTVTEIRKLKGDIRIEVLIPDFKGDVGCLKKVIDSGPDIINHNVETVPSLYPEVRPQAVYGRSLAVLGSVKKIAPGIRTKSGIMLGLGETEGEVVGVLKDLRAVGCDMLTIGQYLAPSASHHTVVEYVHPNTFKRYGDMALEMGFMAVASDPLVRSSYMANRMMERSGHCLPESQTGF